jgi:hypothetical protein
MLLADIPPGITNAAVVEFMATRELLTMKEPAEFANEMVSVEDVPRSTDTNCEDVNVASVPVEVERTNVPTVSVFVTMFPTVRLPIDEVVAAKLVAVAEVTLRVLIEAVVDAKLEIVPLLIDAVPIVRIPIEEVVDAKLVIVPETASIFCTVAETILRIPIEAEVAARPPGTTNAAVDPFITPRELLIIKEPPESANDIYIFEDDPLI